MSGVLKFYCYSHFVESPTPVTKGIFRSNAKRIRFELVAEDTVRCTYKQPISVQFGAQYGWTMWDDPYISNVVCFHRTG